MYPFSENKLVKEIEDVCCMNKFLPWKICPIGDYTPAVRVK